MGYGARALQALNAYYSGEYFNLDESAKPEVSYPDGAAIDDVRWKLLHCLTRELILISLLLFLLTTLLSDRLIPCLLSCNVLPSANPRILTTLECHMD
jgi:hypothetical protein